MVTARQCNRFSDRYSKKVECKRNVMAHTQKPDSVFQRNGRVHLYRRGCQFSRVLVFLECGSGENDCSNTGWTVPSQTKACLATHSIRLFPFTSPPVRRRVPPDSVSTLHPDHQARRVITWTNLPVKVIVITDSRTRVLQKLTVALLVKMLPTNTENPLHC